jgi:pimeloyl-ACP methyl ester carboxylesterase
MSILTRIGTSLGGAVDGALLGAARLSFARHSGPRGDRSRMLAEASAFYRTPALLDGGFFPAPERTEISETRVRHLDGGEVVDVTFPSGFRPHWERMRPEWEAHVENRVAHIRMLRHATPHPSMICLHGYAGGRYFFSEVSFVTSWLYKIGLDVALFTLPFHGARAPAGKATPIWPSPHVARFNEGFGQAIYDLRVLCSWLRRRGSPSVSVCGMSLGGYTTALLATVEPLDFAAPMIPVASFADLFWEHGEGRAERAAAEAEGITLERMKAAMEVTTPLSRAPLLSPERVLVIDAAGDRIAPRRHAAWLAEHFKAQRLTFEGGHVLQLGRGRAFRAVAHRLNELSLLPRR